MSAEESTKQQSEKEISRTPPDEVQRKLRQEVGFGCPVPGCREPFLSWHHFDPPWSEEHHHRQQGMIALCVKHHAMADAGNFDRSRLHELKGSKHSAEDVRAKFEWARSKQLIRLGGLYTTPVGTFLLERSGHFPVLTLNANEEGLLEVSFRLQDQQGHTLAEMKNNMFQATPPRLFDIEVNPGGTKIKVRVKRSEVILDLWSKGIGLDNLDTLMQEDWKRWRRFRDQSAKLNPSFRTQQEVCIPRDPLHPDVSEARVLGGQLDLSSLNHSLPSDNESGQYRDITMEAVRNYALSYLRNDNDQIHLLDCRRLVTYMSNVKCEINRGIAVGQFGLGFGAVIVRCGSGP